MFIDGILGNDFPRPLSFYLERYPEYLERIKTLVFGRDGGDPSDPLPIDDPWPAGSTSAVTALVPACAAPSEPERRAPCKGS